MSNILRRHVQKYFSAFYQESVGFARDVVLMYQGAAVNSATNNLAKWVVPVADLPAREGYPHRVANINLSIPAPGTGATNGNWTFTLTRASDGAVIGTIAVPYNATAPMNVSVDLRDTSQKGPHLTVTDTLILNLTGVPGGAPVGFTCVYASVTMLDYGTVA